MTQQILIAEDDIVLREVYHKKLTLAGYDVLVAANGEEAEHLLQEHQPDLAILDIHMPKLDGFALLENIPKAVRKYPVLMLTNFGDAQSQKRGYELGVSEFFIKSEMTMKTLLQAIERYLRPRG
jgi:DNA-binding response OmpR family regulator